MKKIFILLFLLLLCCVSYANGHIYLNRTRVVMHPGERVDLYADVWDFDGPVYWQSTDSHIASVDNGRIYANRYGKCFIKACIPGETAYCEIIVTRNSYYRERTIDLTLNETNITLNRGETFHLQLFVNNFPEDRNITYKTKNTRVATIDNNGVICAQGIGTTSIEVEYGGKAVTCKVRVIMNRRKR